jgi:hypothetical protein
MKSPKHRKSPFHSRGDGAADQPAQNVIADRRCVALAVSVVPAVAQTNGELPVANVQGTKVDKTAVFVDSLALLAIEHGIRLALQPKTRDELRGNFWQDYRDSVHWPKRWEDTDPWPVNYLGHPIHGAAAGYLWLEHDPNAPRAIEFDGHYGRAADARLRSPRPTAFSSKSARSARRRSATLACAPRPPAGGLRRHADGCVRPGHCGGVLDRFLVEWAERHTHNRVWRASLRMIFSPSRVMANTAARHLPWYRPDRTLAW